MEDRLGFLLDKAGPAIRYRIKTEVINAITDSEREKLQAEIVKDPRVQQFIAAQQLDGWINADFHSAAGGETAIRLFRELGIERGFAPLDRLVSCLQQQNDLVETGCLRNVGKILDRLQLGGSRLICAAILAQAGDEDSVLVKREIEATLEVFRYVTRLKSLADITYYHRGHLVFRPGVRWPSIYHLRLLAYTESWRIAPNRQMIIQAVGRLVALSPLPQAKAIFRSQLISPASFAMDNMTPELALLTPKQWMMWFHRMELLARLGVVTAIPELEDQCTELREMLSKGSGIFARRMSHYYFTKWGPYTGLALERDFRSQQRYLCDLLFRSMLIIHYAKNQKSVQYLIEEES